MSKLRNWIEINGAAVYVSAIFIAVAVGMCFAPWYTLIAVTILAVLAVAF